MSQRKLIGYWLGAHAPDLPDPRDFIDPSWDLDERRAVSDYLKRGRRARAFAGPSRCRLCGELVGSLELEDSVYAWPEGLAHYVEKHAVKLPPDVVAHVLREIERERKPHDTAWWRTQPPTGTARHWPQWVVTVSAADRRRLEARGELLARHLRPLAETARLALPSRADAERVVAEMRERGVEATTKEEIVPVPDQLLA